MIVSEEKICQPEVKWPMLRDYQKNRVCTLLDPTTDPLGKGFHIIQGEIAIGSGGTTGKGFMKGTQTHLEFIPERTTDFIFAAFSEEFGLVGCCTLLVFFVLVAPQIMPPLTGDVHPIIRMVDVLPAPLGPRNPNASPGATWKSTPSTAENSPKRFVRPVALISGSDASPDRAATAAVVSFMSAKS